MEEDEEMRAEEEEEEVMTSFEILSSSPSSSLLVVEDDSALTGTGEGRMTADGAQPMGGKRGWKGFSPKVGETREQEELRKEGQLSAQAKSEV